ncbi:MAG: 3-hydroxyacyl-ACP dehydratase [Chitinophagaceae bacterium]|nr:MAG: 3-hydroxyacyl-ACP dehydratase [Chitinophagaceae bacterium]
MSLVDNIESLIPQRWPFKMISELEYCEGDTTRSSFTVAADNIFVVNGRMREPALVENIAQTAAARAGWLARQENRPVTLGYIGAIQKLEIFGLPEIGDTVSTEIKVLNQVFDVTLVAGKLSCKGKVMASCEMKIFITKTP